MKNQGAHSVQTKKSSGTVPEIHPGDERGAQTEAEASGGGTTHSDKNRNPSRNFLNITDER